MWLTYDRAVLIGDLANIALIASLAIGLIATFLVVWTGNVKEDFVKKTVAAANAGADTARSEAALASRNAATATLELDRLKAPRSLTKEQQDRIVQKMRAFAGQEFSGLVASGTPDSMALWQSIAGVLLQAGWVHVPPTGAAVGDPAAGVPAYPGHGVTLIVDAQSAEQLRQQAFGLSSALVAEGITASPARNLNPSPPRPTVITIEVGTKP